MEIQLRGRFSNGLSGCGVAAVSIRDSQSRLLELRPIIRMIGAIPAPTLIAATRYSHLLAEFASSSVDFRSEAFSRKFSNTKWITKPITKHKNKPLITAKTTHFLLIASLASLSETGRTNSYMPHSPLSASNTLKLNKNTDYPQLDLWINQDPIELNKLDKHQLNEELSITATPILGRMETFLGHDGL